MKAVKCLKNKHGKIIHSNAREVTGSQENGWPAGDTVIMECPDCGLKWRKELPQ